MSDSKEMLEATVKGLKEKLESVSQDLKTKTDELADVNKPTILQSQFEIVESAIYDAVEGALGSIDSNDYDVELELSGNEIEVYSIDFHNVSGISEEIALAVDEKFRIVDEEDEDETTTDNS